jgi:hypothetical protein
MYYCEQYQKVKRHGSCPDGEQKLIGEIRLEKVKNVHTQCGIILKRFCKAMSNLKFQKNIKKRIS